jgi:hypothetical protein
MPFIRWGANLGKTHQDGVLCFLMDRLVSSVTFFLDQQPVFSHLSHQEFDMIHSYGTMDQVISVSTACLFKWDSHVPSWEWQSCWGVIWICYGESIGHRVMAIATLIELWVARYIRACPFTLSIWNAFEKVNNVWWRRTRSFLSC